MTAWTEKGTATLLTRSWIVMIHGELVLRLHTPTLKANQGSDPATTRRGLACEIAHVELKLYVHVHM